MALTGKFPGNSSAGLLCSLGPSRCHVEGLGAVSWNKSKGLDRAVYHVVRFHVFAKLVRPVDERGLDRLLAGSSAHGR